MGDTSTGDHDGDGLRIYPSHVRSLSFDSPRDPLYDGKICINVSGHRFELMRKTLRDFPLTRLGKIVTDEIRNANTDPADPKRHNLYDYYDTHLKEYYFQRNPGCFPLVISYYVDKVLHVPRHMCAELFQKEMEYWCIPFNLTDCCQGYHRHEWETTEGVRLTNQLLEKQTKHSTACDYKDLAVVPPSRITKLRAKIWDLFENSESSKAASLMSIFSSSMVILSTIVLCISTHPDVRIMNSDGTISDHPRVKVFEIICIIWFTFEYVIRTATCPSYKKYFMSMMNHIDLVAILPFYITIFVETLNLNVGSDFQSARRILQVLRIFRVMRIFKVARHSAGLQVLGYTVKNSLPELGLLLMLLLMGMTLFSSLVYYAEIGNADTKFESIIAAFWWAIITMTTVGYGDMAPQTTFGKVIGSLCCLSGILFIALPIPTIVSNFSSFYKDHRNKEKLNKVAMVQGQNLTVEDLECPDGGTTTSVEFLEQSSMLEKLGIRGSRSPSKGRLSVEAVTRHGSYLRRLSTVSEIGSVTNLRLPTTITEVDSDEEEQ